MEPTAPTLLVNACELSREAEMRTTVVSADYRVPGCIARSIRNHSFEPPDDLGGQRWRARRDPETC